MKKKILFVVTEDWYFLSHRIDLATHAIKNDFDVFLIANCPVHKDIIEQKGIKVFDWKLKRKSFNPFREILSIFDLLKCILKIKPDIIHAVAMKPIIYSSLIKLFCNKVLSIYSFAGLGYIFTTKTFKNLILKKLLLFYFKISFLKKNSYGVMQNSDDLSLFQKYRVMKSENLKLIEGSGINETIFDINNNSLTQRNIILLAARMLWTKGIKEFVECARIIKAKKPDLRFVLVGAPDNENKESIPLDFLYKLNESNLVEWWGHKKDLIPIYKNTLLVLFPSYREGLPKSLLEAASCKLPIISFNVTGCRSIVKDGINGFLIPFMNTDQMSNKTLNLINNEKMIIDFGKKGREIIKDKFTLRKINNDFLKLWFKVFEEV